MGIHAKTSPTRRTWCFTSYYDQGDRASKNIYELGDVVDYVDKII